MKTLQDIVRKEISEHIKNWKDVSIDLSCKPPCEPKHNRQCMYNAMNEFKADRACAIMEVASAECGVVHYLCVDKNGDVYDPTLGWSYSGTKYKLIQYIHPETSMDMNDHLNQAKQKLFDDACSKTTKALCKIGFKKPWDFI